MEICQSFQPDILVIDPLPMAWPVHEENDNAEADRQMTAVKNLALALNCVIIAMWNMGEGKIKEKFRARGATARIDRSDLTLNYTHLADNKRRLKIVKSRYGTLGRDLKVGFAGELGFELVEGAAEPTAKIEQLQAKLKDALQDGRKERKELVALAPGEDALIDKALRKMVVAGDIIKPQRGVYELPTSSEPPTLVESEIQKEAAGEEATESPKGEPQGGGLFANVVGWAPPGEFDPLPVRAKEGAPPRNIYLCSVKAEQAVSKAENDMIKMTLTVVEPEEFAGETVWDYFNFHKRGDYGLTRTRRQLTQFMGQEWVDELEGDLVTDIIPTVVAGIDGMQVAAELGQEEYEYQGEARTKNTILNYFDQDVYYDGVFEDGA